MCNGWYHKRTKELPVWTNWKQNKHKKSWKLWLILGFYFCGWWLVDMKVHTQNYINNPKWYTRGNYRKMDPDTANLRLLLSLSCLLLVICYLYLVILLEVFEGSIIDLSRMFFLDQISTYPMYFGSSDWIWKFQNSQNNYQELKILSHAKSVNLWHKKFPKLSSVVLLFARKYIQLL